MTRSQRHPTILSPELAEAQVEARSRARDYGLDFFEIILEVLDYDTMNQLAAYGGFPIRYPHWHWGMEYEKIRKRDVYGMGRIYEMVINNDPSYAYLQESNSITGQKLVTAHVYGHSDFFKCNAWFGKTKRNMMDEMANHATRVQRHIDAHGAETVERFLDTCLSIEYLIDPHSMFLKREASANHSHAGEVWEPDKIPAKEYMDRHINPPEYLKEQRKRHEEEMKHKSAAFPAQPTRDVLLFLLRYAPLSEWQQDILSIIRDESYYFAPQGMTKIMNEGWATYWHSKIMTTHMLEDWEIIDYAEQHSGVVHMEPGGFNPYKIGVEIYKDIEQRWNTGRHGPEWERLTGIGEREKYDDGSRRGREKIFEVRRVYNDVTFIDEFLTPELIEKNKMYHFRTDPHTGKKVIASRDPNVVKQVLLYRIANMGQPFIYVADANYLNRGELYLAHQFNGLEVDAAQAVEVLRAIQRFWQRPVHLQFRMNEEMTLLSCTGEESSSEELHSEKINDETPPPIHLVQ